MKALVSKDSNSSERRRSKLRKPSQGLYSKEVFAEVQLAGEQG